MYHLLAGYKRASSSKLVLAPAQPATCGSGILRANQVICGIFRAIPLEQGRGPDTLRGMTWSRPFRHFRISREIIRLAMMLQVPI